MLNINPLEHHIENAMREAKVPGVSLAISREGQVWYARGFGVTSVEHPQPVTPETLFRIGSITKPMTAALILHLAEEGRVNLDVPVSQYVPDIQFSVPAYTDQITLRRLLSHNAGLQTSHAPFGRRDPGALEAYIREEFPKYEFVAPPGVLYSYSNPGIRLAGYVAQIVMGEPYTELMQRYIFDPLNMRHTTFDPTVAMTYPVAQSHDLERDGRLQVQPRFADNAAQYPSGGIISNVMDLLLFVRRLLVSSDISQQMQTRQVDQYKLNDSHYGLGLNSRSLKGIKYVGHDGSISTFGSKMAYLPDHKIGIALLFNRAPGFWTAATEIMEQIITEMLDLPPAEPVPVVAPLRAYWGEYVGTYLGLERGYATVQVEGDDLILTWNGQHYELATRRADLFAAGEMGVGFVAGYLMIDGSPLARTDRHPIQLAPNPAYAGIYRGVDELQIRVENGQMWVYSEEYGRELLPCLPLDEKTFASSIGILEFEGDTVRQSKAYVMRKISAG